MILIVDDDEAVLHSLELLLKQAGFTTASAGDPKAALAYLDTAGLELVLQDMNFSRQKGNSPKSNGNTISSISMM